MGMKNWIKKKWARPNFRFLFVASALWIIFLQTSMLLVSYERNSGCSWRPEFWGVVGLLFGLVFVMALVPSLFCWCFKFIHWKLAWGVLFLLWGVAMWHAVETISPTGRFKMIAGEELAALIELDEFVIRDSFGDGRWARGVFRGDPAAVIGVMQREFTLRKDFGYPRDDRHGDEESERSLEPLEYWSRYGLSVRRKGDRFIFRWIQGRPETSPND